MIKEKKSKDRKREREKGIGRRVDRGSVSQVV